VGLADWAAGEALSASCNTSVGCVSPARHNTVIASLPDPDDVLGCAVTHHPVHIILQLHKEIAGKALSFGDVNICI